MIAIWFVGFVIVTVVGLTIGSASGEPVIGVVGFFLGVVWPVMLVGAVAAIVAKVVMGWEKEPWKT